MWNPKPAKLALSDKEVHVWRMRLNLGHDSLQSMVASLSEDELARAEKFHFDEHRNRFVARRGQLRAILAEYTGASAAALRFQYAPKGKPFLADSVRTVRPRFNLSHSADIALVGVTCDRELGIDVERVRCDFGTIEIAKQFFSSREIEALQNLPPTERDLGFFRCWTRKEAYLKARGEGLLVPLDRFVVSLRPEESASLLHVAGHPEELTRWTIRDLSWNSEFAAAVIAEGNDWSLRCWDWSS